MKLESSGVPEMYKIALRSISLNWDEPDTINMYDILFTSFSQFLGDAKSKEHKTAVVLEDLKGNFKIAGIVEYHPAEEDAKEANEAGKGNWSLVFTFDEADTKDCKIFKTNDNYVQRFIADRAYEEHAYIFDGGYMYMQDTLIQAADVLKLWLDKNANTEDNVLEIGNLVTANISIEGDKKYYGIVASETLKQYIKDDASLSITAA